MPTPAEDPVLSAVALTDLHDGIEGLPGFLCVDGRAFAVTKIKTRHTQEGREVHICGSELQSADASVRLLLEERITRTPPLRVGATLPHEGHEVVTLVVEIWTHASGGANLCADFVDPLLATQRAHDLHLWRENMRGVQRLQLKMEKHLDEGPP